MNYYLGVNGGGSGTDLLLADQVGKVLAQAKTGPLSFVAVSKSQALENLKAGLEEVTADLGPEDEIIYAVLGVASVDTEFEEELVAQAVQPILEKYNVNQFTVINDAIVALVNATDKENALVLVSGTGSNCYGENEQGEVAKASGFDYLLSDQGSGYAIGLAGLKAGLKSADGRGKKSSLEQQILKHFQVKDYAQLKNKIYQPNLTKSQVAELALLVFDGLDQGDLVCQQIVDKAVHELWQMVQAVAEKLEFDSKQDFDLVLEGSVAQSAVVVQGLKQRLEQNYLQASIVLPHQSAVYGALELAMTGG